jgi:two-component system, chemotaxis family, sensor kinase CheA
MNEFLEQFVIESRELVEQATADLLAIEESPEDKDRLDSVFRAFHTLKGAAGIVDFIAMGQVLHAAESLLVAVRAGDHPATADLVGDGLACLDQILQWLDVIEATQDLPTVSDETTAALAARFDKTAAPAMPAVSAAGPPDWLDRVLAKHSAVRPQARLALRYAPDPGCFFRGDDPLALIARLPGLLALDMAPAAPWPGLETFDPFACNLVVTALTSGSLEATAAVLRLVSDQVRIHALAGAPEGAEGLTCEAVAVLEEQGRLLAGEAAEDFPARLASAARVASAVLRHAGRVPAAITVEQAARADHDAGAFLAALDAVLHSAAAGPDTPQAPPHDGARALRVDVERIDTLVKLTSELTVVKNTVGHAARLAQGQTDPAAMAQTLKDQHALLDRLVGELQRSVLGIRVLPLRQVFQRFPRLVREVGQSLGKPVRLVTEGETTEADKAIVEGLFEPILHVLRNALDHGIEDAPTRRAAGKPPTATLRLAAARESERVIVTVADDGGGIDVARIRQVAAERGVATAESLAGMTEDDVVGLIFTPGFSTAATVTGVSGRGVGMDAVRAGIAQIGGQVRVETRAGEGTTVRFMLPFSVMMSRVMTVEAGGQIFGIPFDSVVETLRLPHDRIARLGAAEAFVLREKTVPLIRLASALGLADPPEGRAGEAAIVVAAVNGELGGIEVDRFGERLDVMLKPMEGLLARTAGLAGTTLLGDGRVLIVLDLVDLLE